MEILRPPSKQPIPPHAKKVFSGVLFDVYQWEQEMFDGTKAIFEKVKRPDTAVVLLIMDDGKILLIEQEQPGKDALICVPGGRIDEGEDILEAAKRELLEETGYEATEFILWDAQQPSSKVEWAIYTFIAKGVKKLTKTKLDAGERINLKFVTFEEFIEIVASKNFEDTQIVSKVYEAMLHAEKKEELRKLFKP